jgi:hypothetical protein
MLDVNAREIGAAEVGTLEVGVAEVNPYPIDAVQILTGPVHVVLRGRVPDVFTIAERVRAN